MSRNGITASSRPAPARAAPSAGASATWHPSSRRGPGRARDGSALARSPGRGVGLLRRHATALREMPDVALGTAIVYQALVERACEWLDEAARAVAAPARRRGWRALVSGSRPAGAGAAPPPRALPGVRRAGRAERAISTRSSGAGGPAARPRLRVLGRPVSPPPRAGARRGLRPARGRRELVALARTSSGARRRSRAVRRQARSPRSPGLHRPRGRRLAAGARARGRPDGAVRARDGARGAGVAARSRARGAAVSHDSDPRPPARADRDGPPAPAAR